MSEKQIELYKHFLSNHRQTDLFTNYNVLQMIWTHPKLLKLYSKRTDKRREVYIKKNPNFINNSLMKYIIY